MLESLVAPSGAGNVPVRYEYAGRLALYLTAGFITALPSCSSDPTAPNEPLPPVDLVEINPVSASLQPGDTLRFTVSVRAANGAPLSGRAIIWSSTDTTVATITSTGLALARAAGDVVVRATVESRMGQAALTVTSVEQIRPRLDGIAPQSVPARSPAVTIVLTGTHFNADAQVLWNDSVRPSDRISTTEMRLTVGPSQLMAERTVQLVVRNPGHGGGDSESRVFVVGPVAVDRVTVSPSDTLVSVGGEAQLTATAYAADGSILSGRSFVWSTASIATASVSSSGLATGRGEGTTVITVESEGRSASASVRVVTPVALVLVNPNTAAVLENTSVQLQAVTLGPTGAVLNGRPVTWSSESPTTATVDGNGLVTGLTKGTARIVVESEGKVGVATVEVRRFSDGPVQGYFLRGTTIGLMPSVGTMPWHDADGVAREATLYLSGGNLQLDSRDGSFSQSLALSLFVEGLGFVGDTTWVDDGSYTHDWIQGTLRFQSSVTNAMFTAHNGGVGELLLDQVIGNASGLVYRWVIE